MYPAFSKEEKESIKNLLLIGRSAVQIGRILGRTRKSILGFVHRNQEIKPVVIAKPKKPVAQQARAKMRSAPPITALPAVVIPAVPPEPVITRQDIRAAALSLENMRRVPLRDLERNQCHYEISDDILSVSASQYVFCGLQTDGGKWCASHKALVYTMPMARNISNTKRSVYK